MSELFLHSALFGAATLISRILGLVRDAAFAHYFGRSAEYDAYLIAILLPFFLRKIFAEGAMSSAFIPLFARKEGKEAQVFLSTVIWATLFSTAILYLPILFFSDQVSFLLGSGLTKETLSLAGFLMKFTYPFIIFISLWAIIAGVLNNKDSYFVPAIAPALSNISTILFTIFSLGFVPRILGPTIGFVIGGFLQFIFVFYFMKKMKYKITFDFNKIYLKQALNLFGPALLGVAISTLNTLVDTNVATWTGEGGVSTIQYALRIYQLPLGIFGVSVANSLLPKLSKAIKDQKEMIFNKYLIDSILLILFFTIPATLGIIFMSESLVFLLYEHGNFIREDTVITAKTLIFYSIGLPFYSLYGILVRTYHSKLNTKFPTIVSAIMLTANIILDIILVIRFGIIGIAIATSISGFLGTFLAGFESFKKLKKKHYIEILKILTASVIMSLFIIITNSYFNTRILILFQILLSVGIFIISCFVLKIEKMGMALKLLKIIKK